MLVNTQVFREAALYYQKHGRYDDGDIGTNQYDSFWEEERRRCLYGYKVGDTWITGDHYFYLNHWQIKITDKNVKDVYGQVIKDSKKGNRISAFPDFWDVDYEYFHECEKARLEGKHMLWLKPRGVGASYKFSGMAGKNYFLVPGSKSYMFAFEKEYLTKDGVLNKFIDGREFVNKKRQKQKDTYISAFGKPSDYKQSFSDMVYRASTNLDGEETGYMSEVMGVTFKDNWEKGRGKRGVLIGWEEMGKFPKVNKSWNITRDSVEEDGIAIGLMIGFGTGGSEGADFAAMEEMFYNPVAYNVRCFDNVWDEGMAGTVCGYFTPAYRTIGFKDKNGNSLEKPAREHYEQQRRDAKTSNDPNTYHQRKAEKPFTPQDAILNTKKSIMPKGEAKEQRLYVMASPLGNIGVSGKLENVAGTIKFKPDPELKPILNYPHSIENGLDGCVVQYFAPYKVNGIVPDNLYIIGHDPYAHDSSTDLSSIGSTYVYMNPNRIPGCGLGDRIVASYNGRPSSQDEYNRILFLLAEYYNAKIGFENDRGDVIGYAKRKKKLYMLADEFELAFDSGLASKVNRKYGMHMGSGKENKRKLQGDKYIADWLDVGRGSREDGKLITNLHTIYDTGLLQEIEKYNTEGNFDRMAALRIIMYYAKELEYNDIQIKEEARTEQRDSLWTTKLYA